jgi:NADH:ubiquinone oxidoreductase subunit 6 (subunit J)
MPHEIIFFILAAGAVLFAVLTISARTVVYSSIFFALTLLATAGIYLQLRAPLLFAAQLIAIFCVVAAIILVAVEVSKLDLALTNEYHWCAKAAVIAATVAVLLEIACDILQRRFLPGERLTVLLPKASFPWPLSVVEILRFFVSYDLLPLALMALAAVIATVGIRAVFQRRA